MNLRFYLPTLEIRLYINKNEIFKLTNDSFLNSKIGFFSSSNGTSFTQFLSDDFFN